MPPDGAVAAVVAVAEFVILAGSFVAANAIACFTIGVLATKVNPRPSTLFFVPNLIGYIRLGAVLAMLSLHVRGDAFGAALCYAACATLDGFDGYYARKLGQCSKFGEALDVAADNAARAALWVLAACELRGHGAHGCAALCAVPIALEYTCAACTHAPSYAAMTADVNWKDPSAALGEAMPWLLQRIFANGFKNPLGATAIGGLFFLPFLVYVHCAVALDGSKFPGSALPAVFTADAGGLPASPAAGDVARWAAALPASTVALGVWLVAGRALCAAAEVWLVGKHARVLLATDRADAARKKAP